MSKKTGFLAALFGTLARRGYWTGPLTLQSPELARLWSGPSVSTGMSVNEAVAFTYSVFWACVNNISTDIAAFPLRLYKRLPNGGKEPLLDHKLYRVLHDVPNPEMTAFTFRGLLTTHALTCGMGYAEIVRNGAGQVVELWPITPDRVQPKRSASRPYSIYYEVTREDGGFDQVPRDRMFVLPGSTHDGVYGRNIVNMARESIGLGLAAERFGGTFFGNGATFGGVFEHPGRMSEQAVKNFRASVNTQHQGVERAHRFIVTEEGMKYQKLGVDPNAAQFLETRMHQVEEMCRWFRMPPHKVQHLIKTSYNSVEQLNIEYSTDTLTPWCVRWEQEILRQLIAPSEQRIQFVKHTMDSKLRGDTASRYEAYSKGIQFGFLSADDVREKEDLNPLPDGQGQIYLVPQNMAPANRINDIVDKQVAPDPAPVMPEPASSETESEDDRQRREDMIRMALADVQGRIDASLEKVAALDTQIATAVEGREALMQELRDAQAALEAERVERASLQAVLRLAEERTAQIDADRMAAQGQVADLAKTVGGLEATIDAVKQAADADAARLTRELVEAALKADTVAGDLVAARQRVADLETGLAVVQQTLTETQDVAADARRAAEDEAHRLRDELAAAVADRDRLVEAEARAVSDRQIMQQTAVAAGDVISQLRAQLADSDTKVDAATISAAAAEQARHEAEQQLAALRERLDASARELAAVTTAHDTAQGEIRTALERAEAAHREQHAITAQLQHAVAEAEHARQRLADETAKVEAADADRLQAVAQLRAAARSEAARVQAQMTAHRDLVADLMGREIGKETERVRRNAGTPEKLTAWMGPYYALREDALVDALRPAMRPHLAVIGSTEDVDTYTRAKIRPQLQTALLQLRAVAEGDPEDYAVALEHVLTRWERERPAALADLILQEEVSHVRSL